MPAILPQKKVSVEECDICHRQYQEWLARKGKDRSSINRRINEHKLFVHEIPFPQPPQPKKPKIQPPQPTGEGRWIKPVDSQHVKAQWYPKGSSSSSTSSSSASSPSSSSSSAWVPASVVTNFPPSDDEEDDGLVLINGFELI
jgi:hypothetical protein